MQEIRIMTEEDVVETVEREFKEKSRLLVAELVQALRDAVSQAVGTEIPQALEEAFAAESARLKLDMVEVLEEALRRVVEQPALSPPLEDPEEGEDA